MIIFTINLSLRFNSGSLCFVLRSDLVFACVNKKRRAKKTQRVKTGSICTNSLSFIFRNKGGKTIGLEQLLGEEEIAKWIKQHFLVLLTNNVLNSLKIRIGNSVFGIVFVIVSLSQLDKMESYFVSLLKCKKRPFPAERI